MKATAHGARVWCRGNNAKDRPNQMTRSGTTASEPRSPQLPLVFQAGLRLQREKGGIGPPRRGSYCLVHEYPSRPKVATAAASCSRGTKAGGSPQRESATHVTAQGAHARTTLPHASTCQATPGRTGAPLSR